MILSTGLFSLTRIATIVADGELQMRFATPVDLRIVSSALAGKSNAMSDRGRGGVCAKKMSDAHAVDRGCD